MPTIQAALNGGRPNSNDAPVTATSATASTENLASMVAASPPKPEDKVPEELPSSDEEDEGGNKVSTKIPLKAGVKTK